MAKDALASRQNLLGPIMAFRALSGETEHGGADAAAAVCGVQVVRGVKSVGGWVRPGLPIGAKVDLVGSKMYEFLGTLTEFVLPRLREASGPCCSRLHQTTATNAGWRNPSRVLWSSPRGNGFLPPNRGQPGRLPEDVWDAYPFYHKREGGRGAGAGETTSLRISDSVCAQVKEPCPVPRLASVS